MHLSGHGLLSMPRGVQAEMRCYTLRITTRAAAVPVARPLAGNSRRRAVVQSTARQVDTCDVVQRLALAGIEVPDSAAKRNPQLAISNEEHITSKVEPMLEFLVSELAMQPHDIEIMLLRCPKLFAFSVERQCRPVVAFLGSLGFNQQQVSATVKRFPHMLGYDTKGHLVPHCHYLKSLGLTDEELPQLILARPHVLGTSIELVITYLRKWLRIERTNVGKLLWSYPLDYSLPRLVMPSKLGPLTLDSLEATRDEDTPTNVQSSSSGTSGSEGSSAEAQQGDSSSISEQEEQWPVPPLGSPDRCTWLDVVVDSDQGNDSNNSSSKQ